MRELTQEELEACSGVSQAVISHIECGQREPRVDTIRKLARALQMSASLAEDGGLLFEERRS